MKKKVFLGLLIILSLLCGAWYLGLFEPEWKKYSLESPYVKENGQKAPRKSDETKIDSLYEQLRLKGLIYQFSIEKVTRGEEVVIDKLCSINVYSLNENNLSFDNNISDYLNNKYINNYFYSNKHLYETIKDNLNNTQPKFHIESKVTDRSDYDKRIIKWTHIFSNWLPANIAFAINVENIFDKVDKNGFVIEKTTANYPNQWKQLELCLRDIERNGRELNKYGEYLVNERTLHNKNNDDNSILKNKIKNTILSDKSFIRINDNIRCWHQYDPQGYLDNKYNSADYWKDKPKNYDIEDYLKDSGYRQYKNYKQYGKAFHTWQDSFIDIYNVDKKMYIRVEAIYDDGLPYMVEYCEE